MSFRGKKGKDTETFEDFDDTGAATPGELAAPGRAGAAKKPGGGRSALLLVLLLLVAGGIGGGYYYMSSVMEEDFPPPRRAEAPPPAEAAAPETAAVPADISASPVVAAPGEAPPPEPVTADSAPPQDALGAPPPDTSAEAAIPVASPVAAAETTAPAEAALADADLPAPAAEEPDDLPVPPGVEAITAVNEPAPAVVSSTEPPPAEPLPVLAPAPVTAAEKALADNAPVLDQLSQPAAPPAAATEPAQIPTQEAIVRPLPTTYVIVKKDRDGGSVDARLGAARTALASNRNQAALQLFSEMEEKYPGDTRVLMGRAIALQRLGQAGEALAAYETVLSRDPKNLEALTNMLGLVKAQDPALALDKLRELREAYPANADIAAQLGISYGGSGDYANALKYLDMAEALSPGNPSVTYNKAVVYDRMGDSARAAPLYRRILELSSEGAPTQQLPLEAIRKRLGNLR